MMAMGALASFKSLKWVYTRYADDLIVSLDTDDPVATKHVVTILDITARGMGWSLAQHKTRIQRSRAGRRVIVGVSVDQDCRPTRKVRRKLRAAQHQNPESPSARGLGEWCLLRKPKATRYGNPTLQVTT
jgi:hypothetical protein